MKPDLLTENNDGSESDEYVDEIMEMFELPLPNNDKINAFKIMSNEKRIQCIYAGIHTLDSLENLAIKNQNSLMHKKFAEKENKYKKKINDLQCQYENSIQNIEELQQNIDFINKQHFRDLKSTTDSVQQKCSLHFQTLLDNVKKENEELRKNLNNMNEVKFKEKEKWMIEQNQRIDEIRKQERARYEKYIECDNERLKPLFENQKENEELKRTIKELRKIIDNNSSIKGKAGEFIMVDYLNKFILDYQIEFIGKKQKNAGDILLENNNYKIMVESKDYKKALPKKEIDKFIRDHKSHPEYNASILINLHEEIACHNNLQLE